MKTYEIRETSTSTDPAERGRLIGLADTWQGARAIRDAAVARGIECYIVAVEVL